MSEFSSDIHTDEARIKITLFIDLCGIFADSRLGQKQMSGLLQWLSAHKQIKSVLRGQAPASVLWHGWHQNTTVTADMAKDKSWIDTERQRVGLK